MGSVTEVTDATFAETVLNSSKPVLVDYWADWCAPCKQLSPILDELAAEYSDRITFAKIDTNANPQAPAQQGIMSLPTLQLFVDGTIVSSITGSKTKNSLLRALEDYL
ncbi:MAG: thioredoxin [Propioniciclava sp.]